jgi:hypothetical protein
LQEPPLIQIEAGVKPGENGDRLVYQKGEKKNVRMRKKVACPPIGFPACASGCLELIPYSGGTAADFHRLPLAFPITVNQLRDSCKAKNLLKRA